MRLRCLVASLMLVSMGSLQAAQVYKWIDANGIPHFDAKPPTGQVATPIDTHAPPPASPGKAPANADDDDVDNDPEQKDANAKVREQVAEQEEKTKEFCEQARTNLAQLNNNPRVRQEVDGELRRLTEEERQAKISETRKAIADQCH
ncbi:DUF4124 domain-containing protein [Pseudomonas sp. RIT-PI-S]|uniref:DUF4124 domain-containing protein n=1 Tax=Pseudomonas sp. RIT-PI-S TaxID=3035295 RepID=UPI0021DB7ECA|nr:DUF4124 domain-containing protein [Pseudomonas sp. RIT-PI-S]